MACGMIPSVSSTILQIVPLSGTASTFRYPAGLCCVSVVEGEAAVLMQRESRIT